MRFFRVFLIGWIVLILPDATRAQSPKVHQTDAYIEIKTDLIEAQIRKKGYVSGTAAGTFLDKKTGLRDLGFGLHIMDFLMAPGWADDGYPRDRKFHGDLPKHYIEGPQICTKAKQLSPEVIEGKDFVAIRHRFRFEIGRASCRERVCVPV